MKIGLLGYIVRDNSMPIFLHVNCTYAKADVEVYPAKMSLPSFHPECLFMVTSQGEMKKLEDRKRRREAKQRQEMYCLLVLSGLMSCTVGLVVYFRCKT